MKYCQRCGAELLDEAVICPKCGCDTGSKKPDEKSSSGKALLLVAKIFMIIACFSWAPMLLIYIVYYGALGLITLVSLCWTIPMTVHYWRCCKNNVAPTTAFKVCTLIFVSLVAGILMLVASDSDYNA